MLRQGSFTVSPKSINDRYRRVLVVDTGVGGRLQDKHAAIAAVSKVHPQFLVLVATLG